MIKKILTLLLLAALTLIVTSLVTNNMWVSVTLATVVFAVTALANHEILEGLKQAFNHINVHYVIRPYYIYDLLVRSKIHHPLTSDEIEHFVDEFLKSRGRARLSNPLYGDNYYQFSIASPPEAIQLRWHPTIESLDDLDEEEPEETVYELLISLASPHKARINELNDKRMESLVSLLAGLSNFVNRKLGNEESRILITVNRLEGNKQPEALKPPSSAVIQHKERNGATVISDNYALQVFSSDPSAVILEMSKNLENLAPT